MKQLKGIDGNVAIHCPTQEEWSEKKLPEKWAIKTGRPEFFEWFNTLLDAKKGINYPYDADKDKGYFHYPSFKELTPTEKAHTSAILHEGYTLITFEDWAAVYRPDLLNDTRKIIGYKAPFDMYQEEVKHGDLFTKIDGSDDYWSNYSEKDDCCFPAEWVERYWEPVYEEEQVYELVKKFTFDAYGQMPFPDSCHIIDAGFQRPLSYWLKLFPFLTEADIKAKPEWFKLVEKQ